MGLRQLVLVGAFGLTALPLACENSPKQKTGNLDPIISDVNGGNCVGALGKLDTFLEKHPKDGVAWVLKGKCLLIQERVGPAEQAYRKAVELEPRSAAALTGLGICHRKQGRDDKALEQYGKAVVVNPKYGEAWSSMSVIELKLSKDGPALDHARKAYKLDGENPTFVANLALALHYNGKVSERDEMIALAKKLNYPKLERLKRIVAGELSVRK